MHYAKFSVCVAMGYWIILGLPSQTQGQTKGPPNDASVSVSIPPIIRCYGHVVDDDSQPVSNANVMLIAPNGYDRDLFSPFGSQTTLGMKTTQDGKFELSFDRDDTRFLSPGNFKLVIFGSSYAAQVRAFPMDRLLVDLGHSVKLSASESFQIKLVDDMNRPIAGARISPARISGQKLPPSCHESLVFETNELGVANIDRLPSTDLQEVYFESSTNGNQQVSVPGVGSQRIVKAAPTGTVRIQFRFAEAADPSWLQSLRQQEWVVATFESVFSVAGGPRAMSWQRPMIDEKGRATINDLGLGHIRYSVKGKNDQPWVVNPGSLPKLDVNENPVDWQPVLHPAKTWKIQFTNEAGKPLGKISVNGNLTDEQGQIFCRFHGTSPPNYSLHPVDAFAQFIGTSPFGFSLEKQKMLSDVEYAPAVLVRTRSIDGWARDSEGTPIPGATINYSYAFGRFQDEGTTTSDKSGRFLIRGLPPRTAVKIEGFKDHWRSSADEPVSCEAGSPTPAQLVLHPLPVASPTGIVIDQFGMPVAGAIVKIKKATVLEKEGFSAEWLSTHQPLSTTIHQIITDSQGRFQHPQTTDFSNRMQVNIKKEGYFPLRSRLFNGSHRELVGGELSLGKILMIRRPVPVATTVMVRDSNSRKAIADAEIVFMGIHTGRHNVRTDQSGRIDLQIPNSGQLVAIRAEGYPVYYQWLDEVKPNVEFEMSILEQSAKRQAASPKQNLWFMRSSDSYRSVAKSLYGAMEQPVAGHSSYFRQSLFFRAQSFGDPDAFFKLFAAQDCPYQNRVSLFREGCEVLFRQRPREAIKLLNGMNEMELPAKSLLFRWLAFISRDQKIKNELYGEALIIQRQLTGNDALVSAAQLSKRLVLDGRKSEAVAIMTAAWDSATDLHALLESGQSSRQNQIARSFAPSLALIHTEKALRLIELTASQVDVDRVQSEAMALMALVDPTGFSKLATSRNQPLKGYTVDGLMESSASYMQTRHHLADWASLVAEQTADSSVRVRMYLSAARMANASDRRQELMHLATGALSRSGWIDQGIIDELMLFPDITSNELDALIFQGLANGPSEFTESYQMNGLGHLCRLLAFRRPDLAKSLLAPAFAELSWLHGDSKGYEFLQNEALSSALWIDPKWTEELLNKISDTYNVDSPHRSTELACKLLKDIERIATCLDRVNWADQFDR